MSPGQGLLMFLSCYHSTIIKTTNKHSHDVILNEAVCLFLASPFLLTVNLSFSALGSTANSFHASLISSNQCLSIPLCLSWPWNIKKSERLVYRISLLCLVPFLYHTVTVHYWEKWERGVCFPAFSSKSQCLYLVCWLLHNWGFSPISFFSSSFI